MVGIAHQLAQRRDDVGLTNKTIAERAGLGIATIQRALSGDANTTLHTLEQIADVLGMQICAKSRRSVNDVRLRQARDKAERLVAHLQATSALEAQALEPQQIRRMIELTVKDLLRGSNRRLWAV